MMIEFIGVYKFNLRDLNFKIENGEFVCLCGNGGAGKTTILKLIAGEITPERGTIKIATNSISRIGTGLREIKMQNAKCKTKDKKAELRKENLSLKNKISYIAQSTALLENKDVFTNIVFPLKFLGKYNRSAVLSILSKLGLNDYWKSKVCNLPCSYRQLLKIALQVVKNPILLLADEPLTNLDAEQSSTVLALLKDMHSTGTTILLATSQVTHFATKELHLINGEIIKESPKT